MYRARMNNYYPEVIKSIQEFQAIIDATYPEFEELEKCNERVLADAYLQTMNEERVEEWESMLGIRPLLDSTIEDRRDTIIARIRSQGKLNTEMINTIVGTFTGGTANSWVADGVLYVEITPPPDNKSYRFENVEQELAKKVPAHLGLSVKRNYATWGEIKEICATWANVNSTFKAWEDVLLFAEVAYDGLTIIKHPEDQSVPVGGVAKFTVVAVGDDIKYKWQYQTATGTKWIDTALTGYNTDTLSVDVTSNRNGYKYRCVLTDKDDTEVISNYATLTIS